jgi:predicted DNA-binding protein with PD1-like motif
MKRLDSDSSTLLVLERGEELHESLQSFAFTSEIKSAWLSGLGGATSVTLGFYDIATKSYIWKKFDEPLEIVSLTGNLSFVDDKPFWHVHGSFSGRDFKTISGHVKELVIGLTGELLITPLTLPLSRSFDETTGLKLID